MEIGKSKATVTADMDVWKRYRAISSKYKTRFMKRPNIGEIAEDFRSRARQLENGELRSFAAVHLKAVAKGEEIQGHWREVAAAKLKSARLYFEEERESKALGFPSEGEHLLIGMQILNDAIKVYKNHGQFALASMVCWEGSLCLREFERHSDAVDFLQKAAELEQHSPWDRYLALKAIGEIFLEIGDYDAAVHQWREISRILIQEVDAASPLVAQEIKICEIIRLLLLLFLYPSTPREDDSALLRRYMPCPGPSDQEDSWIDESQPPFTTLDEHLALSSIAQAVEINDMESLVDAEDHIVPSLSTEPYVVDLLRHLVLSSKVDAPVPRLLMNLQPPPSTSHAHDKGKTTLEFKDGHFAV
ncbi:unnamed protein product [Cyprideis torosa]|uniref:Uncharacterized protein n=1 Tax=Cyprideis torosa TaxID=163714 RepID=A0A7R8WET2_9CRUS|nr:unnamed protein product [Cyprideis torosa]CAG0896201.1 unnamed protein product [Cyprideis torosa]